MHLFFAMVSLIAVTLAASVQAQSSEIPVTALRQLAEWNRLDVGQFSQCVKDKKYAGKILADENEAIALGAQGTPFSIVLGPRGEKISISGAASAEQWQDLFDALLGESPTPKPGNEIPGRLPTSTNVTGSITPIDPFKEEIWGNPSGAISMVIYTDFDCPFCKSLHDTINRLPSKYFNNVSWVYRHFPLRAIHPTAEIKANAAECAHAQSPFVTLIPDLFSYQDKIDVSEFAKAYGINKSVSSPNTSTDPSFQQDLPDTYHVRDVLNDNGTAFDQELVRVHGGENDDQSEVIIPSIRKALPKLSPDSVLTDFSKSYDHKTFFFRAFAVPHKYDSFYKFDVKTKKLTPLKKINSLYKGGSTTPSPILSPSGDRFLWVPTTKNHSARQLYVFDLLADTRKLIISLPASQTFDAGDPKSTENFIGVEWLSNNKIGYTVFSQSKKAKVDIDDKDWRKKLFIKDGLKKLTPVRY